METYQILGLVGSLLLALALAIIMLGMAVMPVGFGMMGPMMWSMGFFPFLLILLIGLPSIVLGIVGSVISDRTAAGVLLILAGILSLPVFFGFFGISLILLIIAGALALSKR